MKYSTVVHAESVSFWCRVPPVITVFVTVAGSGALTFPVTSTGEVAPFKANVTKTVLDIKQLHGLDELIK